jgi:pyruvate/2-oxoglutarate dehydrogenase complex dihydrolipoamide dehydrogenase (E3) component
MAEELTPDICVIGGGPGGIALAAGAARLGVPVVLVEKGRMGGANLSRGSVPARALAAAAGIGETLRRGSAMGVAAGPPAVDLAGVRTHIAEAVEAVAANVSAERLAAFGAQVIAGTAAFADPRTVMVGDQSIRARRFVIAAGALPKPPALPGLGEVDCLSLDAALGLAEKPSHLVVYGADARGLELAQAWRRLGIETTVIDEGLILGDEDPELAAIVLDRLRADGLVVHAGLKVGAIARRPGGIRIAGTGPGGEVVVDGSHLVFATGRAVDIDGLGLHAGKVDHEHGFILVDRAMRTSNRRVYAIGDAVTGPASANRAEYEAMEVLRSILYRWPRRVDPLAVPVVVFTDPALARVGMSEVEAARRYNDVRVLRWPFVENDLAQAEGTTAGVVKVLARSGGEILGAAIVGRDAGEMIGLWALAIARRLSVPDLATMVPPYPSRMDVSRRVAETFAGPGQAPRGQRRLIEWLRKLG